MNEVAGVAVSPTRRMAQTLLLLGWALWRFLSLRPKEALQQLRLDGWLFPALVAFGAIACGLRWGVDLSHAARNGGSFLLYMCALCFVGPRCRKFVMGYCLMSGAFDLVGLALLGPVIPGVIVDPAGPSNLRLILSGAELAVTLGLIVASFRLPRDQPAV